MGFDYSFSMEGLRAAERQLNQAARRVSKPIHCSDVTASAGEVTDRLKLTGDRDIARAMVGVKEAKTIYKANLKIIDLQTQMEEETLDLFG